MCLSTAGDGSVRVLIPVEGNKIVMVNPTTKEKWEAFDLEVTQTGFSFRQMEYIKERNTLFCLGEDHFLILSN